jgi:hypothetical protein
VTRDTKSASCWLLSAAGCWLLPFLLTFLTLNALCALFFVVICKKNELQDEEKGVGLVPQRGERRKERRKRREREEDFAL